MKYTDKPIEERQSHIDLESPCEFVNMKPKKQSNWARIQLERFLSVQKEKGCQVHTCHLCPNHSKAERVCVNPKHLYFGTPSENEMDKSPETRAKTSKAGGKIGGKIAGKIVANRPDHPNKLKVTCPYCGTTGAKMIMSRWHFDNCRRVGTLMSSFYNTPATTNRLNVPGENEQSIAG